MLGIVLLFGLGAPNLRAEESGDEAEILQLERALTASWGKPGGSDAREILADDMQYWSFKGVGKTKADLLRTMETSGAGTS